MVMANVFRCLWFDAEEAAEFYMTLLPNSHIDNVWRSPAETPSGPAGMDLTVDFTVAGQQLQGLNGGPEFRSTSRFVRHRLRGPGGGGSTLGVAEGERRRAWPCGWLKDRPVRFAVSHHTGRQIH
jgi:3-demethylubiquinone-9 3-methyltransferase